MSSALVNNCRRVNFDLGMWDGIFGLRLVVFSARLKSYSRSASSLDMPSLSNSTSTSTFGFWHTMPIASPGSQEMVVFYNVKS